MPDLVKVEQKHLSAIRSATKCWKAAENAFSGDYQHDNAAITIIAIEISTTEEEEREFIEQQMTAAIKSAARRWKATEDSNFGSGHENKNTSIATLAVEIFKRTFKSLTTS